MREADETLTQLEALWPKLSEQVSETGRRLGQAQTQLESLGAALQLWRENSDAWEKLSQDSRAALATAQTSVDALTLRYAQLWRLWQDYRKQAELQIATLDRRLRVWRTVAVAGTVAALVAGFLAGVLAR